MRIDLPTGKPVCTAELFEAANRVDLVAQRAEELRDAFVKKAEKVREEVVQQFAGLDMDQHTKSQLIRQQVNKRLAELQQEHIAEADKILKDIGGDVEAMNNSAPLYGSKLKVIGRLTLASPERATFSANLASAGPVELANAATHALATGNLALASAIVSRLQAMEPDARPFSPNSFADRFEVKEYDRAQEALKVLRHRSTVAINAQREIRNPSSRLIGRILNSILKPSSDEEE